MEPVLNETPDISKKNTEKKIQYSVFLFMKNIYNFEVIKTTKCQLKSLKRFISSF